MLTIEPESRALEGTLVLAEGRIAGVPVTRWSGEVFWDRSILSIGYARGTFASGNTRLQLHQPLPVAAHPASLVVDLEGASLEAIFSGVSGSPSPLESRLSGRGDFSFDADNFEEIQGSFELQGVAPASDGPVGSSTPLSFRATGGVSGRKLEIQELQLETPFLSGTLSGTYPREGPANLSIDFTSSDLAAAEAFQREIQRVLARENDLPPGEWRFSGRGRAFGRIRERVPRLVFEGELLAEDLKVDTLEIGEVRTKAIVARDAVTFQDLVAVLEGGRLSGRGYFSLLGSNRERDFDLDLELSRWAVGELPSFLGFPHVVDGPLSGRL
jgi:hypothetical protein